MDMTLAELAVTVTPALTRAQARALVLIAEIPPAGVQRTGHRGRPAKLYDQDAFTAVHQQEAARTSRPFEDGDWMAHALLARHRIRVDLEPGAIWWADGTRAETLGTGNYGWVRVGSCVTAAHRVIWIAANGEIPPCMQVNHINRLRWDNRYANLELTAHSENMRHMHGLHYLTRDAAMRELAALEPAEEPDPWKELMRAPGAPVSGPPGMAVKSQVARARVRRH